MIRYHRHTWRRIRLAAAFIAIGLSLSTASAGPLEVGKKGSWPAWPEPLGEQTIPTEKSERPTPDDWKAAKRVEIARRSSPASSCRVYLVREWLKVHCDWPLASIRQLAGPRDDVLLWVNPDQFNWEKHVQGGQAIVPLRTGETRLIEFAELDSFGYGFDVNPWLVLETSWRKGESKPTVILR